MVERRRRLTPEDRKQIVELEKSGRSHMWIAKQYSISRTYVRTLSFFDRNPGYKQQKYIEREMKDAEKELGIIKEVRRRKKKLIDIRYPKEEELDNEREA